jgi:hypothetical protein
LFADSWPGDSLTISRSRAASNGERDRSFSPLDGVLWRSGYSQFQGAVGVHKPITTLRVSSPPQTKTWQESPLSQSPASVQTWMISELSQEAPQRVTIQFIAEMFV